MLHLRVSCLRLIAGLRGYLWNLLRKLYICLNLRCIVSDEYKNILLHTWSIHLPSVSTNVSQDKYSINFNLRGFICCYWHFNLQSCFGISVICMTSSFGGLISLSTLSLSLPYTWNIFCTCHKHTLSTSAIGICPYVTYSARYIQSDSG